MITMHAFSTTSKAYDGCNNGKVKNGELLFIAHRKVIGIADTWPVAITKEEGTLHGVRDGVRWEEVEVARRFPEAVRMAVRMANELDWEVAAWANEMLLEAGE